jgi:hypothetical protein
VPTSTTSAKPANSRLLARNAPSRDTGESMRPGLRRTSARQPINPTETSTMTARKPSSAGPIADWVKAWTELTIPERVRNVPKIVNANVAATNERFQTRNIPRRSWTSTECR